MTQIDDVQLQDLARQVAREESRTLAWSVYADRHEGPICIVGRIFSRLGVPTDVLYGYGYTAVEILYAERDSHGFNLETLPDITDRGQVYLAALQKVQDSDKRVGFKELVDLVPLPAMAKANYDIEDLVDRVIAHGVELRHEQPSE